MAWPKGKPRKKPAPIESTPAPPPVPKPIAPRPVLIIRALYGEKRANLPFMKEADKPKVLAEMEALRAELALHGETM